MSVELAVVMPVAVVVALIIFNLASFIMLCAKFDRVSLDAVIAHGVAPAGGEGRSAQERVRESIVEALAAGSRVQVEVAMEDQAAGAEAVFTLSPLLTRYRCTLRFFTWPGPVSIAGVDFSPPIALVHERSLVVDRFKTGVVV